MRVSVAKVAEHRAALLGTATRLLRERGFDGTGVDQISREAGLTQGALYRQFGSKDAIVAEAVRQVSADRAMEWQTLGGTAPNPFTAYLDSYLSDAHVSGVGSGCLIAACVSEVRRHDQAIGAAFTDGFAAMVEMMQQVLPASADPGDARRVALAVLSGLVGSVAIARAVASTDPALAREIIAATRSELEAMAGRPSLEPPA